MRMTAKSATEAEAQALLDAEDAELRTVLGQLIFGIDDETMESAVLDQCRALGFTLGVAESLTGGLIGARLSTSPARPTCSADRSSSYATDVKRSVLGVTAEKIISGECAQQMAEARAARAGRRRRHRHHRGRGPRRAGGPAGRHGLVRDRRARPRDRGRVGHASRSTASGSASSPRSRSSTSSGCASSPSRGSPRGAERGRERSERPVAGWGERLHRTFGSSERIQMHVPKPVDETELTTVIAALIGRKPELA